jgi:hypothetical protein
LPAATPAPASATLGKWRPRWPREVAMREVSLPDGVQGRPWLPAMPGRSLPVAEEIATWQRVGVNLLAARGVTWPSGRCARGRSHHRGAR